MLLQLVCGFGCNACGVVGCRIIDSPREKLIANTANVDRKEAVKPVDKLPINIIDTVIKRGNLPLQGTKLLVKIAINFSLGESIILKSTNYFH